jgi:predicted 3-demethylubiquinone-9 3-methyltransferase (glyoxalase superfamily)/uncharacterized protein YndB with AHSA1/START domain
MTYLGQKLRTCWWLAGTGEDAVAFWTGLIPGSHVEGGHGATGAPRLVIEFTLGGAPMMVLNAAGAPPANHAASFSVLTLDQAETDRLWDALKANGGKEVMCGWVTDRFGVSWQIVPKRMPEMLASPDREAAGRAMAAMQKMVKLDIAALEAAFAGRERIGVQVTVNAPLAEVWRAYTTPADIMAWNAASDDWHTTAATVDLREGGAFSSRMEAKDGSAGFDFAGTYTRIVPHALIEYAFGDRQARVEFTGPDGDVTVRVSFDAETTHTPEQQREGWQAILDRFKRHAEANGAK